MNKIKTLKEELQKHKKEDKAKLKILMKLALEYKKTSLEKSLEYAEQVLKIAEKINDPGELSEITRFIAELKNRMSDFTESKKYIEKSIQFAKQSNKHKLQISAINELARIYMKQSNFKEMLNSSLEMLSISQKSNDQENTAISHHNLGIAYRNLGENDKALENYLKTLKIFRNTGDIPKVARVLNSIGIIYETLNDIDKAFQYYQEALQMLEEINDKNFIYQTLNNLGNIYEEKGELEKALDCYQRALEFEKINNYQQGISLSLNNIGYLYEELGENEKALDYYLESLKIKEKLQYKRGIAQTLNNIASVQTTLKNYPEAEKNLKKALKVAREIDSKNNLRDIYHSFYMLYTIQKKYKKALDYFLQYTEIMEKLQNIDLKERIEKLQIDFEVKQKEKEAEILEKKNIELQNEITRRKKAEKILKNNETELKNVFNSLNDLIFVMGKNDCFEAYYSSDKNELYVSPEKFLGKSVYEIMPKEVSKAYKKTAKKVRKTGISEDYEYFLQINGEKQWFSSRLNLHDDKERIVASVRNITAQKKTEKNILDSEKKYKDLYNMIRLMSDTVPDLIWAKDADGKFIFTNEAMCKKLLSAKDTDEPIGKTDMFFANRERNKYPENKEWHNFGEICVNSDKVVLKNKKPQRFDEFGNVQGKFLFLDVYKAPIFDEKGKIIGTVGSARDVTREKALEKERQKDHEKIIQAKKEWEQTFDSVSDIIMIINKNYEILRANKAFYRNFGLRPEKIIGSKCKDFCIKSYNNVKKCPANFVFQEGKEKSEILYNELLKKYYLYSVSPLMDNGKIWGVVSISRDITEIKKTEENLKHHQEHIELINKILRHDLTNHLAVIKSAINIYKNERDKGLLDEASNRVFSSVELIRKMKNLETVISSDKQLSPINIKEVLKRILSDYRAIEFKVSGKASVMADDALYSVLNNIIQNAVEHGKASRINIKIQEKQENFEIRIEDNGVGIPDEIKKSIFEEGFKFGEKGHTGLGLFIVKNAVKNYEGNIRVEDNIPNGTVFILELKKSGGIG